MCYKDWLEYMRYDRETMGYSFLDFSKMSMEGELDLQGYITGDSIPSAFGKVFRTRSKR